MTVNDAAIALGITPDSVRARLRRGSLAGEKIGPIWYVHLEGGIVDNVHNSTLERDLLDNVQNVQELPHRATRHDTSRDATRQRDTTSRDTDRDELVEELRRDKAFLQERLEEADRQRGYLQQQLERERQRADVLQALGSGEIRPDSGRIPDESPTVAPELTETSQSQPTGVLAWWRRFWRHVEGA